ncbi:organic solvent ABC transporter [Wolbachia pipientis]|uniref:Organic solvent ABC transporter n=1 Tax=Wolbachia pipientis TaxID=955 RepID=A0A1E7QKD1_WOLPI|nr:ABC transporter substrate-binding protein [Wolbachia pipientis]OEY86931.1 organic solvent ABC transporter [Wolbachia pipientis]
MNVIKIFIIMFLATSAYADCRSHKDFIYALKNQMVSTVGRKSQMLQSIIRNNLDLKKISRFIIGKHWVLSQDATREDFLREYEAYFVRLCTKILYDYIQSSEMSVMGTKKVDDRVCIINTRFSHSDNEEFTNIDFQVTKKDNSFLISDITVSGISVLINQRAQFNKRIDTYGIEQVIKELKCNNNL